MHKAPAAVLSILGAIIGTPWLHWHELVIRSKGETLTPHLLDWAEEVGITSPESIRILERDIIPLPAPMFVRNLIQKLGFPAATVGGLCLRHGIYLAKGTRQRTEVLKHELIHTRQYQELGGIFPFLTLYLFQSLTVGYIGAPLEVEARRDSTTDGSLFS